MLIRYLSEKGFPAVFRVLICYLCITPRSPDLKLEGFSARFVSGPVSAIAGYNVERHTTLATIMTEFRSEIPLPEIPADLTVAEFLLDDYVHPIGEMRKGADDVWFIDDTTGRKFTFSEVRSRRRSRPVTLTDSLAQNSLQPSCSRPRFTQHK